MSDPLIGKKLGPYEIREKLGQGGMGWVYKAWQADLEREVAIKILPPHFSENSAFVHRFKKEARTLAHLRHPNLIHVYSVGEAEGYAYFAMELISGKTLSTILRERGALPIETSLKILGQVLAALHCVHQAKLVHRDLKPGNIMIDNSGRVVLMDFGLALDTQDDERLTLEGTVLGTPEYMSPEQAQGRDADQRSDIYSASIILYQMLTGAPPFTSTSKLATLRKQIDESPPPLREKLPDAPAALEEVLAKGLAKNPDDRFQSVTAFAAALVKIYPTASLTALARREQPPSQTPVDRKTIEPATIPHDGSLHLPPPKPRLSTNARIGLAGVSLIALLGAIFVFQALWRGPRPKPPTHPRRETASTTDTPSSTEDSNARKKPDVAQLLRLAEPPRVKTPPVTIRLTNGENIRGRLQSITPLDDGTLEIRLADGRRLKLAPSEIVEIDKRRPMRRPRFSPRP